MLTHELFAEFNIKLKGELRDFKVGLWIRKVAKQGISSETREDTCRYIIGNLIPNPVIVIDRIRDKMSTNNVLAGIGNLSCFTAFVAIPLLHRIPNPTLKSILHCTCLLTCNGIMKQHLSHQKEEWNLTYHIFCSNTHVPAIK